MFALLLAVTIVPDSPEISYRQPQLVASKKTVALTFGSGNEVFFASSADHGSTFTKPVRVGPAEGEGPIKLMLGRHRGPRVAQSGDAYVVSAISSHDGNLRAWRSTDGGRTWSRQVRINDVERSAGEGLHAMAANGQLVYAVWLDHRQKGTRLYGSASRDGGATWSKNVLVYESPDGHICECCHPSVTVTPKGNVVVMWRNWMAGSRDMYTATSPDGGQTFAQVQKQGPGTWPLNACPMDGGGVVERDGAVWSAWRRADSVYLASPKGDETALGTGKDPAIALGRKGVAVAWSEQGVRAAWAGKEPQVLDPQGAFVNLASAGDVFAAWESGNGIRVMKLE